MANPNIPNLTLNDTLNSFRTKFNQLLDSTSATDSDFGVITDRVDSINNTELVSPRIRLTDSTATNTIDGQLTVGKSATFGGDIQIDGSITVDSNFTVGGEFTVAGEFNLETQYIGFLTGVESDLGTPSLNAGFNVDRGAEDSAVLQWNEAGDYWEAGTKDSLYRLALQGTDSNIFGSVRIVNNTIRNDTALSEQVVIRADSSPSEGDAKILLSVTGDDNQNPTIRLEALTDTLQAGSITGLTGGDIGFTSVYGDVKLEPSRYIYLGDKNTSVHTSHGLALDTEYGGVLVKRSRLLHLGGIDSSDNSAYIQWDYVPTTQSSPERKLTYNADSHVFNGIVSIDSISSDITFSGSSVTFDGDVNFNQGISVDSTTLDLNANLNFTGSSGTNTIQSNTDLKIGVKPGENGALILEAGANGATDDYMIFRTRGAGTGSLGTHIFYADSSSTDRYMRFFIPGDYSGYEDHNAIYGPGEMRIFAGVPKNVSPADFDIDDPHKDLEFTFLAVDEANHEVVVGNNNNPDLVIHDTSSGSVTNNTKLTFRMHDNTSFGGNPHDYGQIRTYTSSSISGSEKGRMEFLVSQSGTLTKHMTLYDSGSLLLHTGELMGNASTASAWETSRTIELTGSVTGSTTIDGSGNVAIATTAPSVLFIYDADDVTPAELDGGNSIRFDNGIGIDVQWSDKTGPGYELDFNLKTDRRHTSNVDVYSGNTSDYTWYDANVGIRWYTNSTEDMRLTDAGTLHVDGDIIAYSTTISDERLKENIEPITGALDKINQLNGYTFTYKKDGKQSAGVLAHEVENVLPSAVTDQDVVFHGEEGETYKTVQYDQLHGLLIEAIKELKAEIEELKNGS